MKTIAILILVLYSFIPAYAQHIAMAADRVNVFYENVDNPVTIVVENCNCSSLVISTDNGTVTDVSPCQYIVGNLKTGLATIKIQIKTAGALKHIGVQKIRVKPFPKPVVTVGGKSGGSVNKAFLLSQQGLAVNIPGYDFNANFKVAKFTINIIRKGILLSAEQIEGNRFNENATRLMERLQPGDQLIFNEIFCTSPDKKTKQVEPISFNIVP